MLSGQRRKGKPGRSAPATVLSCRSAFRRDRVSTAPLEELDFPLVLLGSRSRGKGAEVPSLASAPYSGKDNQELSAPLSLVDSP
jgi:hypothetical protein